MAVYGSIGAFVEKSERFEDYCDRMDAFMIVNEIKEEKLFPKKDERYKLMLFEEQCTESFLRKKDMVFHSTQEERVKAIADKVESLHYGLQDIVKVAHALEDRHIRLEEYTLQILDVVGHLQLSFPAVIAPPLAPEEEHSESEAKDTRDPCMGGAGYDRYEMQSDDIAPKFDRMFSMPAYNQRNVKSPPNSPPVYFRKKLPLTNPYQYRKQFTSKTNRKGSVRKAILKFKRRNSLSTTVPSPLSSSKEVEDGGLVDSFDGSQSSLSSRSTSFNRAVSGIKPTSNEELDPPPRPRSSTLPPSPFEVDGISRDNSLHIRARQTPYPQSNQQRYSVPDFLVDWQMPFPGYFPANYSDPSVSAHPPWADVDLIDPTNQEVQLNFNTIDNEVDRRSHTGIYDLFDGIPRNPMGRTGLIGRGLLGRWGPNHAADPIVTRWKRNERGEPVQCMGKNVLEFVAIQRRDNKEWAIPGGMVEVGSTISKTLKKEFFEEALCSLQESEEKTQEMATKLKAFFSVGVEVYKGYVDDPRNTDNAWMETVAINFHDETGDILETITLKAGDDACSVRWQEVSSHNKLYANHLHILERVAEHYGAFL